MGDGKPAAEVTNIVDLVPALFVIPGERQNPRAVFHSSYFC